MILVDRQEFPVTGDFADTFNSVVGRKSRLVQIFGDHDVTKPLDCANMRHTTVFDWSGSRLFARFHDDYLGSNYAAIDMTRSTGCTHKGLYLATRPKDAERAPAFGVLQSRDASGNRASGKNRFYDCHIQGHLDVGFYNVGAEVSEAYGLLVSTTKPDAIAGIYMANRNVLGAESPFGHEPGNSSSATGALFSGLHVRCDQRGNTTPGVVIDGFDEIKIYGAYVRTGGSGPYVVLDATRNSIDGIQIDGVSSHGRPQAGIQITGAFANGIVNVRVIAQELHATVPVSIGPVDLTSAFFEHSHSAAIAVDPAARLRNVKENGRERVRDLDQTPA